MEPDQKVWNRDKTMLGEPTGYERLCNLESCTGVRISVRWPDGRHSYPCSKGLIQDDDGNMRIGS